MNLTDEMVKALRVVAKLNKSGANVHVAKANYPGDIDKVDYPWAGAASVRAMERRGLVEVSYGVLTGKAIKVCITPEGEAALAELDAVRAEA